MLKTILTTMLLASVALATLPAAEAIPAPVECRSDWGGDQCDIDARICDGQYRRNYWSEPSDQASAQCTLPTGDTCTVYADSGGVRSAGCSN